MEDQNHTDLSNVTESTVIGLVVTFLINQVLPWAIHTGAAILTGVIVAYCVYRFNKWIKKE